MPSKSGPSSVLKTEKNDCSKDDREANVLVVCVYGVASDRIPKLVRAINAIGHRSAQFTFGSPCSNGNRLRNLFHDLVPRQVTVSGTPLICTPKVRLSNKKLYPINVMLGKLFGVVFSLNIEDLHRQNLVNWLLAAWYLQKVVRKRKIDVIIFAHPDEGMIAFLAKALGRLEIPMVFDHADPYVSYAPKEQKRFVDSAEKFASKIADLVVSCGCGKHTNYVMKRCPKEKRILMIPPGFEDFLENRADRLDVEKIRRKLGLEGKFVVSYLGKIEDRIYRVDLLPDMIHRVVEITGDNNVKCLIVGNGSFLSHLKKATMAKGLQDYFVFTDSFVPYKEIGKYIDLSDVGVLPYGGLGCPQKPIEYLIRARPIVLTRTDAIPYLRNGDNCLFAENDPDDFARKIAQIYCDRNTWRSNMQENVSVLGRYSWKSLAEKYVTCLKVSFEIGRQT